jgi:hypothetical protein
MAIKLPRQAFVALAAVGWADGRLMRSEATALVDAARKHGVEGDDLAEVERSTRDAVSFEAFDPGDMSARDRVLTYALASWMAGLDGVQSSDETETLRKLGVRLGLKESVRERAAAAAFDGAVLPGGGKPDRYDFDALLARLAERLPHLTAG